MAKRKIPQTLDFVEGLLTLAEKADEMIGSPDTHPRYITTRCGDVKLSEQLPETLKRLGIYQGRVALALLGAELALKFLWEREQESETTVAKSSHTFPDLFKGLSKARRDKIQHRYLKIAPNPKKGWKSISAIFKRLESSSVQWRYIVEQGNLPPYIVQATYLIAELCPCPGRAEATNW